MRGFMLIIKHACGIDVIFCSDDDDENISIFMIIENNLQNTFEYALFYFIFCLSYT